MKDNNLYQYDVVSPDIPGTWQVKIGVWTWIYTFDGNHHASSGSARWNGGPAESGDGTWTLDNPDPDIFLEIIWEPNRYSPEGSRELWDAPIREPVMRVSTHGSLVGQGRIITANKMFDGSRV